jgi:hypothetical protein
VIGFHQTPPDARTAIQNSEGVSVLLGGQGYAGRFIRLGELQLIFAFE